MSGRSQYRHSRSRTRERRNRDSDHSSDYVRNRSRIRSRSRSSVSSYRSYDRSTARRRRSKAERKMKRSLDIILSKLDSLEQNKSRVLNSDSAIVLPSVSENKIKCSEVGHVTPPIIEKPNSASTYKSACPDNECTHISRNNFGVSSEANVNDVSHDVINNQTNCSLLLAEALKCIPVRSQYYVSNFDPRINDINSWCEEVDRARDLNRWDDRECLSRVSLCLKGDAKVWLSEWGTNDRCWTNFKREFKPLCPSKLDFGNILFDVMNTSSDKFNTYAEYARRSLLRLRIVKGLSEDLMTQIVIRGITDAQVRAATANANVTVENLVSFLSIYVKPGRGWLDSRGSTFKQHDRPNQSYKSKCYHCGKTGHKSYRCTKKPFTDKPEDRPSNSKSTITCHFCKKPGHIEKDCFAKERSEMRNKRNINLCNIIDQSLKYPEWGCDVVTAVVQGIPVDVLIDSGAMNISLISEDVLKYLSCARHFRRSTLKGISENEILVDSYVTLTIELPEISIEADFVVVPSSYMNTPIIIGTDILNRDGVTYVRTKDRQFITRSNVTTGPRYINVVIHDKDVKTPLQDKQKGSLMSIINQYSNFFISGTASTTVTTGEMHINLTSSTPVVYRPYKLSYQEKIKVRGIIRDLLDKQIIRESQSEYSSPIILVKKKDGSDRMCIDFRALNQITIKDRYPMPLIDDHIDRLGNFKYFSSLDMATGFHQIRIQEDSIHKTGFVTPEGHYEFVKMPYGLSNSPIVYQRIINKTLQSYIEAGNVLIYVDDVLLLSHTVDEGLTLLRKVLSTLTTSGFSINLRKCSFIVTEVEYLGRLVSQGQVRPSPRKVEALVNSRSPENVKQVRQFLGLAGYFRRYIQGFAVKTACIAKLTKKDSKFTWGPEQELARQDIIDRLTNEPILVKFNPNLVTEVHTDASSVGYGAVLMQISTTSSKQVVEYFSKVTQAAERKYHSYELETLAVVKALQHFRHYLVGLQFKLFTDCNALKSTERKKDLLPRVARWWVYLQDFTFDIEYRKGVNMSHADFLSRNPISVQACKVTKPRNWAQIAQAADGETRELVQQLDSGALDSSRYVQQNDLLFYRYAPVGEAPRLLCYIPKGHRLSLLRVFHDEHEHVGAGKTIDLILKHFWFPGLRKFVSKYISHCLICISKKRVPRAPHPNITSWEKPDQPFDTVHVDALGPLPESRGYKFLLILVDSFTKYSLQYPIYRQDTLELKRAMTNAISLFGVPRLIVVDRGRMFESSDFVSWIKELGSDLHHITAAKHQSNGQVERYMRTILNMVRIEVNYRDASWSETAWKLKLVLNITKQKTTQFSPLNLLIGTNATTPVIRALVRDIAVEGSSSNHQAWRELCRTRASELLKRNQEQQDKRTNRSRHPPRVFEVDSLVFVIKYSQSTGKLDPGMRGPYRVIEGLSNGRYKLKLLSGAYGKTTQAAAEYMVPWRGEWCPESCAALFENDFDDDSNTNNDEVPVARPSSNAIEGDAASGEAV